MKKFNFENLKPIAIKYIQIIKFGIVGISNTLISWIIYFLLIKINVFYLIANIAAFFCGMLNGFIWNKTWVFKVVGSIRKTFIKYALVNLCTLGLSTFLLFVFVNGLGLGKFISQICATLIIILISYFGNRLWTFKV